ncbi:MAG TPA: glycosyltransferase N-terminal domain-containing protein [Holophagaceae bacterium]|jgi:3-deoxy-D-manno-octulosonic-acid transferase|nr:glycosyltransferase N-terminal domain-containing protein [Holophagaceae bacterium]
MDFTHASYAALVNLAGGSARALRRALPDGWRLRLEAAPPEGLPPGSWIWLHAVSVGELLLAEGLLARLLAAGHRVHLTSGTTAGMALLAERLPRWDGGSDLLSGGAFPVDDGAGLRPFLAAPPALFIALETELWPNLLRVLRVMGTPSVVVNGRLTARSRGMFVASAIRDLALVAARDEASAGAFACMGASNVALGGNLKADLPPPPPLHAGWTLLREAWTGEPVLVAGNTVEGEETLALEAWKSAKALKPGLRLILAPRQPRRFDDVARLLEAAGIVYRRASAEWPDVSEAWRGVDALLLDTLGELPRAYGEGTVAVVGGGWRAEGGHNPLEPARFGMPVLIGPGFSNFEDLVAPLRASRAIRIVEEEGLPGVIRGALEEAPLRPVFSPENPPPHLSGLLGALDRTWHLLEPLLPKAARRD